MREAAYQGLAVERLEFLERAAVDQAGDHLAHLVGLAQVARDQAVELGRVVVRLLRRAQLEHRGLRAVQRGDDAPCDGARSDEQTSELQSLMSNACAVFCLKKKIKSKYNTNERTSRTHTQISI